METTSFIIPNRSQVQTTIEVTITVLVLILAVGGNTLVCFVVYKNRNLRTIPNAFFLNLAVSNLLLALSQLSMLIKTIARGGWSFGERFCHFYAFLDITLFVSSLFTLTAISLNRYFKIVKFSRYGNYFYRKSIMFMIVFIWCLAITLCSGPFFGWGKYQFNQLKSLCSISENGHRSFRISASVVISCCIFIIAICHVKIAQAVRRHRRQIVEQRQAAQNEDPLQLTRARPSVAGGNLQEHRGHDVHIAGTVSVIVVLLCFCWGSNGILDILVSHGVHVTREVRMFGVYMMFLDLVIKPAVYGARNRNAKYDEVISSELKNCRGL